MRRARRRARLWPDTISPGFDKIAIVEVTGRVYGEAVKNQISNLFTMELMKKGYTFIERKDVKAILKEQEFQASDLTTDVGAAKAGQILNVPAVMMIDIPKYKGEKMEMSAKLIDVRERHDSLDGHRLGQDRQDAGNDRRSDRRRRGGRRAVAGGDSSDRVLGGVIGGVVGGVAGNVLSPSAEKQVKKVVAKVVKDFPSRLPPAAAPEKK